MIERKLWDLLPTPTLLRGDHARAWARVCPKNPLLKYGRLVLREPATGEPVEFCFHNGARGRGDAPYGDYLVHNGRLRPDNPAMIVDGFGYSFDLTEQGMPAGMARDPRYPGADRTELRIHPDGNPAGTLGCVGVIGGRPLQERFYHLALRVQEQAGGSFSLTLEAPPTETHPSDR